MTDAALNDTSWLQEDSKDFKVHCQGLKADC